MAQDVAEQWQDAFERALLDVGAERARAARLRDLAHEMLGSLIAHRGADDRLVLEYARRLRETRNRAAA